MIHIEIISLIYKSIEYLNFITNQLDKYANSFSNYKISYRVIANDPEEFLENYLKNSTIPYSIFKNPNPKEYYINRVYRAYNYGVSSSKADYVCLVNSDMAFAADSISNLLKHFNKNYALVSRLVESGKLKSGQYAVEKNFGVCPKSYREKEFFSFKDSISKDTINKGGLYMPLLINKDTFIKFGGYPEGNIYSDGVGTVNGNFMDSGDSYFFKKLLEFGVEHYTVFDSIVYHFQEGEKDA